ncbi:Regulator of nucleoside diphosphate kinase OS=Bosea thiooxidans OX=53254 GN=ARD30_25615 PE=4 SV=1 [Bosea thiooxidans]|nr:regulator of nucleoside diphosphate kinase [Bosea thiooxidans]
MLSRIAAGAANTMPELAAELSHELDRARILPEGRTSIDHARVGSEIVYRDESTKRETTITLVWPQDANIEKNRISVMTPIGVALIGMAAERSIDWTTRSGDVKRLTVLEVREPAEEEAAS